jgi:hypothetical protein
MSGNVQKMNTNLTVATICPIVLNPADAILSFATAGKISRPSPVNSGLNVCTTNLYGLAQVYAASEAGACCGTNTQPSTQAIQVSNQGIY